VTAVNCGLINISQLISEALEGGYFIFGDVSVQKTGTYKLRFHLIDTAPSSR
jgi:hypothetical protein